jgi:UDP-2-acetamido-2,6-beta-L-arabino-hexul-4-ose reductase
MEKFCMVSGEAVIRMRRVGTTQIIEHKVSGIKPTVVEMPIYHTYNIEHIGSDELITLFWTNEICNPNGPDTFYEKM